VLSKPKRSKRNDLLG